MIHYRIAKKTKPEVVGVKARRVAANWSLGELTGYCMVQNRKFGNELRILIDADAIQYFRQ
jgi:hypothetical protein